MEHIKTLNTKNLQNTVKKGGCGECQTSCQSACKTSCTVGNQSCENEYAGSEHSVSSGVKSAAYSYEQKVTGKDFQKDESDS